MLPFVSLDLTPEVSAPITSAEMLVARFAKGEKPRERWRVGLEIETLGVLGATLRPVPHEGIASLLRALAERRGLVPYQEAGQLIALLETDKSVARITLEPGGQVELSGAPHRAMRDMCSELGRHLATLRAAARPLGIEWLATGYRPFGKVAEMPWMPKLRYAPMRAYLPTRGALALDMMLMTASVQASLDYDSEADMASKFATAVACSPIVAAAFANSPIVDGRESGYLSYRYRVWRDVDPDRCGLLWRALEPGFGYRAYLEWALDAPMIFCRRDGRYVPVGVPFRKLVAEGLLGAPPTLTDFEDHLTTLFPEVRLKSVIEVRGADAVSARLAMSLPALWKGLLYDPAARKAALEAALRIPADKRDELLEAVAREGLKARVAGVALSELAAELCAIASGMTRGRTLLTPLAEQIQSGRSPGHEALDAFRAARGDGRAYVEAIRY